MEDRFKFRVFISDKKNSKNSLTGMFKVHSLHTGTNKAIITSLYGNCSIKLENNILMQCTGLKDKNGKLMYEGDIVKIWKFSKDLYGNDKRVIKWNDARCGFRLYTIDQYKRGIELCPQSMVNVTTIEVIGNIFQNPELLKDGK